MVSMVEASSHSTRNFNNDPSMDPIVTKSEIPEGSVDSSVSDPEAEAEVEVLTQDISQTQKRKGGRKPVRKTVLGLFAIVLFSVCSFVVDACSNLGPRTPPLLFLHYAPSYML